MSDGLETLRKELVDIVSGSLIHDTWSWVDGEEAADAFAETLVGQLLEAIETDGWRVVRGEVDGIVFDSMAEARRYDDLKKLEAAGVISELVLQPRFPLMVNGELVGAYRADFKYIDQDGRLVVVAITVLTIMALEDLQEIQAQLDHIDTHFQAPRPTPQQNGVTG